MRILTADHLVTMNTAREVVADAAVAVEGSTIVEVGPRAEVVARHPDAVVDDLGAVVLMPGLVNAHHHSGMLRGTAEGLPVWEWLRLHIDPMHRVLTADDAEASAWLCYAEGILSGTTTVVDMWRYMDGAARAASEARQPSRLGQLRRARTPTTTTSTRLDDNERMLRGWAGAAGGRITPWVGSREPLLRRRPGAGTGHRDGPRLRHGDLHALSESSLEVEEFDRRYGKRPIFALESIGWFEAPRTMFAHAVWLDR